MKIDKGEPRRMPSYARVAYHQKWARTRVWVRRPACLLPLWADKCPCLRANVRMIVGRYRYGWLRHHGLPPRGRPRTTERGVAQPEAGPLRLSSLLGKASQYTAGGLSGVKASALRCAPGGAAPQP